MPVLQLSAVVKSTSPSPLASYAMHQNAAPCIIPTKRSFSLTHLSTHPAPPPAPHFQTNPPPSLFIFLATWLPGYLAFAFRNSHPSRCDQTRQNATSTQNTKFRLPSLTPMHHSTHRRKTNPPTASSLFSTAYRPLPTAYFSLPLRLLK